MACDESHFGNHIQVDLSQFQGNVDPDPAEFVAKEDINQFVDGSKVSDGVSCNDKTVKTCNL